MTPKENTDLLHVAASPDDLSQNRKAPTLASFNRMQCLFIIWEKKSRSAKSVSYRFNVLPHSPEFRAQFSGFAFRCNSDQPRNSSKTGFNSLEHDAPGEHRIVANVSQLGNTDYLDFTQLSLRN